MHINSSEHILLLLLCMLSCIQLFVTLWTATFQAPVSIGFPRQESWSRLPFPPSRTSSRPWDQTPWLLLLLCWQVNSLPLSHLGSQYYDVDAKRGFCFICPFESCFFLFTIHTEVIHCLYIFVNVNRVIPNAFPIIKIATLKIIVLCYLC